MITIIMTIENSAPQATGFCRAGGLAPQRQEERLWYIYTADNETSDHEKLLIYTSTSMNDTFWDIFATSSTTRRSTFVLLSRDAFIASARDDNL